MATPRYRRSTCPQATSRLAVGLPVDHFDPWVDRRFHMWRIPTSDELHSIRSRAVFEVRLQLGRGFFDRVAAGFGFEVVVRAFTLGLFGVARPRVFPLARQCSR